MKNKIFKILLFALIVFGADKIIGAVCKKMYDKSNDFFIAKLRHTLNDAKEEVLIFGSSRAEYHFISPMIQQATGLSVYNCGIGGGDLVFTQLQINEVLKKYTPQTIVIEASPASFFIPNAEENRKILLPYYNHDPLIYTTLTKDHFFEKVKFISSVYPYNSKIIPLIKGVFKKNTDTLNGFTPAIGSLDTTGVTQNISTTFTAPELSPDKLTQLANVMSTCRKKGINLVIVSTPVYTTNLNQDKMAGQLQQFCAGYPGVTYLDYSKFPQTYGQVSLFKDNTHLNLEGATLFSHSFAEDLKQALK